MKRIFSILICCCLPALLSAQTGTIKVSKPKPPPVPVLASPPYYIDISTRWYINCGTGRFSDIADDVPVVSFEQKYFLNSFSNQLKTTENRALSLPGNYIAIGTIGYKRILGYKFPGYYMFSYLIPAKIKLNDALNEKLKGFNLTFSAAGQNVINKNHLEIFFTEGLKLGQLKILNDNNEKLTNNLLAAYLGLAAKLRISRFTIFAVSQFDYNLSSGSWKKAWFSKPQAEQISSFNQNGLIFSVGINYRFKKI